MATQISKKKECEYVEVLKEKYGRLNEAVKMMNTPYCNAQDFIHKQMEHVLEGSVNS
jgi:hypothetical protein